MGHFQTVKCLLDAYTLHKGGREWQSELLRGRSKVQCSGGMSFHGLQSNATPVFPGRVAKARRIHAVVATSFVSWEFVVAGGFVLPRSVRVRFWGAVRA
ncbi:hypothetical protein, partial [Amycolatopsis sp. lyj-84]|uniref:hypothetical protein n=1 Tax=Amycolatopsis sp. lyj-84 TaxID=2789284 RepID=UPI0039790BDB